jgi:hypothetical protein
MLGGTFGLRIGSTANLWVDGTSYIYGNVTCGTDTNNTFDCAGFARFHQNLATDGNITSHGTLNSDGNCDLCTNSSNTHLVRGTATFQENVTCNKQVTITQGVILGTPGVHTYDITCASNLVSNGTTYLNGTVDFAAGQTCTWRGNTNISGPLTISEAATTTAPITLHSPIINGDGGYTRKRFDASASTAYHATLNYNDVVVLSSGGICYLNAYGEDGGVMRICNNSSSTLEIREDVSGHTLRILPANTWIDVAKT